MIEKWGLYFTRNDGADFDRRSMNKPFGIVLRK